MRQMRSGGECRTGGGPDRAMTRQGEWSKELQKTLEERMATRRLAKELSWERRDVVEQLRQNSALRCYRELMAGEYFTCAKILESARPAMKLLSPEPNGGWLKYCFQKGKHMLYPENFPDVTRPECEKGYLYYMELLHVMLRIEEETKGFSPRHHFAFATAEETAGSPTEEEYQTFLSFCRKNYLVEFMRIAAEITPFNTLGHIAGVHHIAMSMARQLTGLGVEVDLPLVSGASLSHDIGKYGCKDSESRRVPYLHYYYTDLCMRRNDMPRIAHIAANHSTWDLELENLSVESLLLIYADFRSKSIRGKDKREIICFYSLKDSFQVILDKLDNVDDAKRERYRRVYEKLKDFEAFLVRLGGKPEDFDARPEPLALTDPALLPGSEVADRYIHFAISHNVRLMHFLTQETHFANILEAARSEKDWKNTRSYLNIFREYCTYMDQKQKLLTISFLYELLTHREGDIRQEAARLMGRMIVGYDVEYRKEIPEGWLPFLQESSSLELFAGYLKKILAPDYKIMDRHREWLQYMLEYYLESVFTCCRETKREDYLTAVSEEYRNTDRDPFTAFVMIIALNKLPLEYCGEEMLKVFFHFLAHYAGQDSLQLQTAILRFLYQCVARFPADSMTAAVREIFSRIPNRPVISILFLKQRIASRIKMEEEIMKPLTAVYSQKGVISAAFLENLKTATPWVCKWVNIEFLLYMMEHGRNNQPVHTVTHLANLLMISECSDVRNKAGETLIRMSPYISQDQRNEVSVELMKGLEMGESQFAQYIPRYLAPLILRLEPAEVDESLRTIEQMFCHANDPVAGILLDTMGLLVEEYPAYRERFPEGEEEHEARLDRILGFLLRGMAHDHEEVSREAFYVMGEYIYASRRLSLEERRWIFQKTGKKALHIMNDQNESLLGFLINAAALNHIYRFLSDSYFSYGPIPAAEGKKIAFFPGSFDPFSLSHRGIVREIRSHGFEVYLAIDEFSWSKRTQPHRIRRKIAAMSTADDPGVFLLPEDIPVNIANSRDLAHLRAIFPDREIYLVAGSDVLAHASAYQKPPEENSVHTFHHIVFRRSGGEAEQGKDTRPDGEAGIQGRIFELTLPEPLEEISSTRIRENIDQNRDITNLIDPLAQNYIYQNNLYLREPQYKSVLETLPVTCETGREISRSLLRELRESVLAERQDAEIILTAMQQPGTEVFLIRDNSEEGLPIGFSLFRHLAMRDLMQEFRDMELTSEIRRHVTGQTVLLQGFFITRGTGIRNLRQILFTETLAYCLKREYTCALYHGVSEWEDKRSRIQDFLTRHGFLPLTDPSDSPRLVMAVDMHEPTTLTKNVSNALKPPFNENPEVLRTLRDAHRKLQQSLTAFRPGELVLSFEADFMNHRMVDMITRENGVPNQVIQPRTLGEKMCVPFGKTIRAEVVPNTVTKALHTERVFRGDMTGFQVEEFPNYASLHNQILTIKSFDRSVILVDDILHKGYRFRETWQLFQKEEIPVSKMIFGILTATGRDLAESCGQKADGVYFLPNLHSWFVEASMYPFIGGDSVRGGTRTPGLKTSVNLILPYSAPAFMMRESREASYQLSRTCLENARDILLCLESEYQKSFERNLTLERLPEMIYSPTCPDKGNYMSYDMNLPASRYVENDLQRLIRLQNIQKPEDAR